MTYICIFLLGTSPLEELDIDMIKSFPLDYLHLVLLGVFRRLLLIWTGCWNKKWRRNRLSNRQINEIDRRLRLLRLSYPSDFHRIPTSIKRVKCLKGVELRSLLLYTGPIVFRGVLPEVYYDHFMYLSLGIRILASEKKVNAYFPVNLLCSYIYIFLIIY